MSGIEHIVGVGLNRLVAALVVGIPKHEFLSFLEVGGCQVVISEFHRHDCGARVSRGVDFGDYLDATGIGITQQFNELFSGEEAVGTLA